MHIGPNINQKFYLKNMFSNFYQNLLYLSINWYIDYYKINEKTTKGWPKMIYLNLGKIKLNDVKLLKPKKFSCLNCFKYYAWSFTMIACRRSRQVVSVQYVCSDCLTEG